MTTTELYQAVINSLPIKEIHPLHKAIMEECCENAINNPQKITDVNTLIMAVQVSFLTCDSTVKGALEGGLKVANADQVILNYRGQQFIITKDSPFLNNSK
jgi:hypothetical protein